MKNVHLIALFFILSNGVNAQTLNAGSVERTNLHKHSLPHHAASTCDYDSIVEYSYDVSSIWQNKRCTYYNSNGCETESIQLIWSDTAWVYNSRDTITYNSGNDETSDVEQTWYGTTKTWANSWLDIYTYNSSNDRLSDLYQQWDGIAWINNSLNSYTYNSNNYELKNLYQTWNTTSLMWVNNSLETNTYNVSNDMTASASQQWNGSTWGNSILSVYTYNTGNKILTNIRELWTGSGWVTNDSISYTYNSSEDMVCYKLETWRFADSTWLNSDSTSYEYNANNINIGLQYFTWNVTDTIWSKTIKGNAILCSNNTCYASAQDSGIVNSYYVPLSSGWGASQYSDSILFYGCAVAGILPVANNITGIAIYPNPAMNALNVEISDDIEKTAEIKIMDVTGKTISVYSSKNGNLTSGAYGWTIDVSKLSAAMYFVEVMTDKETKVMKFIKQ